MATNPSNRLHTYQWTGLDAKKRTVTGEQDAPNPAFLKTLLRRQGINVKRVRKKARKSTLFAKRITGKQIALASRQIATLISAGIPIAQSVSSVSRGMDSPRLGEIFDTVRRDVEGGISLSLSIRKFPTVFDRLYVNLVSVGEESGTLDLMLQKVSSYLERIEQIKGKIKAAMFYPLMVLFVAVAIIAIMLLFVIPEFEKLFTSFGSGLPTLTQAMIDASHWFQEWWFIFFAGLGVGFFALRAMYMRSTRMQHMMDRIVLYLPVFGPVLRKAVIARYCRTLATMFGAGVPLVDGLAAVAGACGNRVYHDACLEIRRDVSSGRPLAASMSQTKLFPSMVLQMVETGEETGELESMLSKTSDYFEAEVNDAVDALSSLIEPFMIVILGGIVGTIVVAMYLPIFKLASAF
jgi:type IV pilus assembly protein PilC